MSNNTSQALAGKILSWMSCGQTGLSSEAMAFAAVGTPCDRTDHPWDPADFNRCLMLLDAVPELRENMDIFRLSPTWCMLIDNWDDIEKCFLEEVGLNWSLSNSAPKTYKLMKSIIYPAKAVGK